MPASARRTMGRGKRREPPLLSFPFPSFPARFHFPLSPASLRSKGASAEEAGVEEEKILKMKRLDLESGVKYSDETELTTFDIRIRKRKQFGNELTKTRKCD